MFQTKNKAFSIGLIMFMMGGCGLAYEYTFSKMSSDLLGNTVRQWAIIIAIMLFAMGVGADLQKRLSSKGIVDKLVLSQIVLGIVGSFGPIALLYAYTEIPYHFFALLYASVFFIGCLIGFEIPLLTRINENFEKEIKINIAHILKMDYIGALFGALLWVFVLSILFRFGQIGFILGGITLLTTAYTVFVFWKQLERPRLWLGAATLGLIGLSFGFVNSEPWTIHAEQRMYRDKIVFSETTPYQHIILTKSRAGSLRCYINGNLQFNSEDEYIYHENLVHPVMQLAPKHDRVLVLGGGDGLAVREILKYPDVEEIIVVDIDPMMTGLARENEWFLEMNEGSLKDARTVLFENLAVTSVGEESLSVMVRGLREQRVEDDVAMIQILNLDAAKFVEQVPGMFDVIIIDFPDPSSPDLAKLYSRIFYENIEKKLTAEGLFAVQSTSPVHARDTYLTVGETLRQTGLVALPYHDNVPSFGEWGWWLGGKAVLHSKSILEEKIRSIDSFGVLTRYLNPDLMRSSFVFGNEQLESSHILVTTANGSEVYQSYLKAWQNTL
jgi:spermidine synthase